MYTTKILSPMDLHLDEDNPRFRINVNPSQEDIRDYMIMHEDVLRLATKMSEMNTILPGERIIIYIEDGKNIVLEGNRRTCAYQLFLNRKLIPENYVRNFPRASDEFLKEISQISVDVVNTRKEAMAYLATRHIESVKTWSSVSKWRISYEYYCDKVSVKQIASILALSVSKIKSNICDYKILLRGLNKENWTHEEQIILSPLDIKPDKLIRLFHLSETTQNLGLYFDDNYDLKSSFIPDEGLDYIIKVLTKKAFIENVINTRTSYSDVADEIERIVDEYRPQKADETGIYTPTPESNTTNDNVQNTGTSGSAEEAKEKGNEPQNEVAEDNSAIGADEAESGNEKKCRTGSSNSGEDSNVNDKKDNEAQKGGGGNSNLPYFFQGINYRNLNPNDSYSHGISRACKEIQLFSNRKLVDTFPMSAAFLTRTMIEHSLIYYSKKHKIQGQNKFIWENISNNGTAIKLSAIIKNYEKNLSNYISDVNMKNYFMDLFSDYDKGVNPLNWVVHKPDEYQLPAKDLIELPRKGLLALINYLIS